jgi:polyhydroxyalkanoate synthesis regulator phasin
MTIEEIIKDIFDVTEKLGQAMVRLADAVTALKTRVQALEDENKKKQ